MLFGTMTWIEVKTWFVKGSVSFLANHFTMAVRSYYNIEHRYKGKRKRRRKEGEMIKQNMEKSYMTRESE